MPAGVTETATEATPARTGHGRLLAVLIVAAVTMIYLGVTASTHATLSGGFIGWSGVVPGHGAGLASITSAEQAQIGPTPGFSQTLWATRPGDEVTFGFRVHNGGPVPVTLVGLNLRTSDPGVINALTPVGAQAGPGFDQMTPFHSVTLGPGSSLPVGLTERVVCDPTIRRDARKYGANRSWLGDATSPVVLHYRVLGITMSQTVTVAMPVLVVLPYRSCK